MAYLAALLIAAMNYAGILLISLIFAGGDGSHDAVDSFARYGHFFLAVTAPVTFLLIAKHRRREALALGVVTIPIFLLLGIAWFLLTSK